MKIWRVETYRGKGPYTSSYETLIKRSQYENLNISAHPTPSEDFKLSENFTKFGCNIWDHDPLKYGFESIQSCRDWFWKDEWIEDLDKRKFYLVEIDIEPDNIAFGEKQIAFVYEKAKSKIRHNVRELLKHEPTTTY